MVMTRQGRNGLGSGPNWQGGSGPSDSNLHDWIALEVTKALFEMILVSVVRFKAEIIKMFDEKIIVAIGVG